MSQPIEDRHITLSGYLYATLSDNGKSIYYSFQEYPNFGGWAQVCQHTIDIPVPEGFDVKLGLVKEIDKGILQLQAELGQKITELTARRNRLLELTYVPADGDSAPKRVVDAEDAAFWGPDDIPF